MVALAKLDLSLKVRTHSHGPIASAAAPHPPPSEIAHPLQRFSSAAELLSRAVALQADGTSGAPSELIELLGDAYFGLEDHAAAVAHYKRAAAATAAATADAPAPATKQAGLQVKLARALYASGGAGTKESAVEILTAVLARNEQHVDALIECAFDMQHLACARDAQPCFCVEIYDMQHTANCAPHQQHAEN
jgi:hypothetical protein